MAVAVLSRDIHDALLVGTLRIDSCVYLEEQNSDLDWLLIWPDRSSAWDAGRAARLGGGLYDVGQDA